MANNNTAYESTRTIEFKAVKDGGGRKHIRKAFLTTIRGRKGDLGKHLVVDGPVTIGRDRGCDLSFNDLLVSRKHAQVIPQGNEQYSLIDLGTTNGTQVNGRPVRGAWRLKEGENIFLGNSVVRFSLANEIEVGFHQELIQLVSTDPLTGLESKRYFDDALDNALGTARRKGQQVAVMMMDMDGIKPINDTYGHLFGAYCIGTAGRIMGEIIGKKGHVCRFGGDEFIAFFPNHNRTAAIDIAERIRFGIENACMEKDRILLRPTISIGVALFPRHGNKVLDLVATADQALYRAKEKGKNRVSVWKTSNP